MIPSTVKAIFLDAVGTLLHPDPPAIEAYKKVGHRFGSRLSSETIELNFRRSFREQDKIDELNRLITSEAREKERWQSIVAASLSDIANADKVFSELFIYFSQPSSWRCDREAEPVLKELSARGYILGIASNFDSRLRTVVAGFPELSFSSHLVISSEVGWRKPSSAFFDSVCQCGGFGPEQVLFVGDDFANDYQGARRAGLPGILLAQNKDNEVDCLCISNLSQLLKPSNQK